MAPPTSERVRNQIILLHGQRYSTSQISARVGVSRKTVQKYIDRLNETGLVIVRKQTGRPEKLTQGIVAEYLAEAIPGRVIEHPAYSPDLNQIENLGSALKRGLRKILRLNSPQNEFEFKIQANQAWLEVGRREDLIKNYVKSMRTRYQAVYEAGGSYTKY